MSEILKRKRNVQLLLSRSWLIGQICGATLLGGPTGRGCAVLVGDASTGRTGGSGARAKLSSGQVIIRQNNEQGPDLAEQPLVDPLHDGLPLWLREVGRELLDGFYEVVGLNPLVIGACGWGQLQQRPWLVLDDLDT